MPVRRFAVYPCVERYRAASEAEAIPLAALASELQQA
jgi:hypothetical protein